MRFLKDKLYLLIPKLLNYVPNDPNKNQLQSWRQAFIICAIFDQIQ